MLSRVQISAFFMALVSSVTIAPVYGAECLKTMFPGSVKSGDAVLQLNGLGIWKATLLAVKVYVAGLYVPQKLNDAGQILGTNGPWQLVLRFVRNVDASDIRDAFKEGFENAGGEKLLTL